MASETKTDLAFGEQFEPDVFWEQHGRKIIAGAVAVLALIGVVVLWQRNQVKQAERAEARLAVAADVAALQAIIEDYPGKPVAARAMLRRADMEFRAGQYAAAAELYQRFLNQFSQHALADTAHLGLAAAREAQGDFEAAQTQYLQLVSSRPSGYAAMAARLGAARCAEALGQVTQARQMYEEIMAVSQGTPWQGQVYMHWLTLSQQATLTSNPPAPAVAIQAPITNIPATPQQSQN